MSTMFAVRAKSGVEFHAKRNYWGLIRELAAADFKLKYQGSVLGYLWSLLKPLAIFGVLYVIFGIFVKFGSNIPNYPLYLLLGIVLWNYFAESTGNGMRAIVDKSDLIRKVYFPRIVMLLASSVSALITLLLNLLIVLVFLVVARIEPTFLTLSFLALVVELFVLSLALSLFLGALYVKYRDFAYIWEVMLQLMFYASPIIYPMQIIPEKYQPYILLSPIAQIIQDSRKVLLNGGPLTVTASDVLHGALMYVPYLIPPVLLVFGYLYFERVASSFAEDV